jgi:hypothetical protein
MENKQRFSLIGLLSLLPGVYLIFQNLARFQQGIAPTIVLEQWRASRNFFYQIYVVLFIIMGIVILFKLEPYWKKVQQVVPSVVISLLVITLSYPISALIFDLYQFISRLFGGV